MLEKTVPVMLDAAPVAPDIMIYPPTAAAQVGSPLLWNSKRLYLGIWKKYSARKIAFKSCSWIEAEPKLIEVVFNGICSF